MGEFTFPEASTDPLKKGKDYILQYVKAAFNNGRAGLPSNMLYRGRTRYAEIKQYALGKYSIHKFRKQQPQDKPQSNADANLDFSARSLIQGIRERVIAKILQREYYIQALAVDALSKSEEDDVYNQQLVKLKMRQMAQQMGSSLANSPKLKQQPGEPEDEEQLEMIAEFGFKNEFAMNAEQIVQLVMDYNKFEIKREVANKESCDIGIIGYRVYLDDTGMVKIRAVNPARLLLPYCEEPDFSDATYVGEAIFENVSNLNAWFSNEDIKTICQSNLSQWGNPAIIDFKRRNWQNDFKVLVVDLQFVDVDTTVYKSRVDQYGNTVQGKTDYADIYKTRNINTDDGLEPKYMATKKQVLRQTKWIVGTGFMYDYGIAPNQNRKLSSWYDTSTDYVLYAWNFHEMMFSGLTERLIPLEDDFYETWIKFQNIKRKLIPYLIAVNETALENVNYGSGGQKWTTNQLVDLAFQSHVVIYRSENLLDNAGNQRPPMSIESTGMIADMMTLGQEMQRIRAEAIEVAGLNSITMGQANAKNLNSTNAAGIQATNDALYLMQLADSNVTRRLADMIVQKAQCAVKYGKIQHYLKSLGKDTVQLLAITDEFPLREFGIAITDIPNTEERAMMLQELNSQEMQGLIEPDDRYMVMKAKNLNQAWRILSYKIKKRKEQLHQQELEKIQANNQGSAQAAVQAEQARQQTISLQTQSEIEQINAQYQWQYIIENMKKQADSNDNALIQQAKIIAEQIRAEAKGKNNAA